MALLSYGCHLAGGNQSAVARLPAPAVLVTTRAPPPKTNRTIRQLLVLTALVLADEYVRELNGDARVSRALAHALCRLS